MSGWDWLAASVVFIVLANVVLGVVEFLSPSCLCRWSDDVSGPHICEEHSR